MLRPFLQQSIPYLRRALTSAQSRLDGYLPSTPIDTISLSGNFNPLQLRYPNCFPRLANVPLDRGIGLDIFSLRTKTHPLERAVRKSVRSGYAFDTMKRALNDYYTQVQNLTSHEWLGLTTTSSVFQAFPSWSRCLPWEVGTPEDQHRAICQNAEYDSKHAGQRLDISHGWKSIGPVSPMLLHLEAERLYRLTHTIRQEGYSLERPGKAVVAVLLYANANKWRWLAIGAGQHRVAVASALELQCIPVYVYNVIRRNEVEHWPQVREGRISRSDALAFFDRLMTNTLPPSLASWEAFTNAT